LIQEILTDENRILLVKSEEVDLTQPDVTLSTTITDLLDTVLENKGFGLSAPQIGVLQRIIVVLNIKTQEYEVYINPKILVRSSATKLVMESSLSRPGKVANMKRVVIKAKGLYSAIFQHQIDYLNGKLIGMEGNMKVISKGE
jgi:peptide deformylase